MKRYDPFQLGVALSLIAVGVSLRLLPHPANFAPITAIAIFGGAVLPRRLAVWVPLAAMMVSDLFLGFYDIIWVTWGCYLLIALVSSRWLRKPTLLRGAALTLSASLFFFIVTNFAVWAWSGMYAHTWHGFIQCYAMALPFFRDTLASDLFYTAALFGLYMPANVSSRVAVKTAEQAVR
ncbi:MAG TPA: DUF6580 family putative transport protein [Candidatus Saccharimonadales bacterium]|jgi:hypothetical protein